MAFGQHPRELPPELVESWAALLRMVRSQGDVIPFHDEVIDDAREMAATGRWPPWGGVDEHRVRAGLAQRDRPPREH